MKVLVIPDIHLKPWIFDRAIAFAKAYPDTLWCYGNHDVSYPWGRLESGYSPYVERTVISKLEELENALQNPLQLNIFMKKMVLFPRMYFQPIVTDVKSGNLP